MFDDSSSWFDEIGSALGIKPPPPQPAAPVFDGGAGGGSASPQPAAEKGVLDSIWSILDGDDEELPAAEPPGEPRAGEADTPQAADGGPAAEAVIAGDPDGDATDEDPWAADLQAVIARSNALNVKRRDLELASQTQEGRIADPDKESLAQDIMAFSQQCDTVKATWEHMTESDRSNAVMDLEYHADVLESEMQKYAGDVQEHDGKLAEKMAIIARVVQPLQNQVITAEAIVRADIGKVQGLERAIDEQRLWTQLQAGLGLLNVALGSFPPTSILATGMTVLQMGTDPSEAGAVELGSQLGECAARSMKFTSKLAGGIGALANVTGLIDQLREESAKYYELCKRLQAAVGTLSASSQSLLQLMAKFQSQMSVAQQYASKATGV